MDQFLHMKNMPGGNCPRGSLQMLWGISQQLYSPSQLWCPLWFHLEFKQALKPLSHLWLGTQVSTVTLLRWVNFKFLIVILTEFGINTKPIGIRGKYQFCSHPLQSWPLFWVVFCSPDAQIYQHKCISLRQVLSHTLSLRIHGTLPSLTWCVHCKIGHFSTLKKLFQPLFFYNHMYLFISTLNHSHYFLTCQNRVISIQTVQMNKLHWLWTQWPQQIAHTLIWLQQSEYSFLF